MKFYLGYYNLAATLDDVLLHIPIGWHNMLEDGFKRMFEAGWDGHITQIKEKFGGLRLYIENASEEAWDIVEELEEHSLEICCVCGEKATKRSSGWVMYYCDEHFLADTHKL